MCDQQKEQEGASASQGPRFIADQAFAHGDPNPPEEGRSDRWWPVVLTVLDHGHLHGPLPERSLYAHPLVKWRRVHAFTCQLLIPFDTGSRKVLVTPDMAEPLSIRLIARPGLHLDERKRSKGPIRITLPDLQEVGARSENDINLEQVRRQVRTVSSTRVTVYLRPYTDAPQERAAGGEASSGACLRYRHVRCVSVADGFQTTAPERPLGLCCRTPCCIKQPSPEFVIHQAAFCCQSSAVERSPSHGQKHYWSTTSTPVGRHELSNASGATGTYGRDVSWRSAQRDGGLSALGPFAVASGLAETVGRGPFGRLADRLSRTSMIWGARLASVVILALLAAYAVLALAQSRWRFVTTYFLYVTSRPI